ncbi:sugar ABC transporter substrate-binding protein [Anaerococcus sp. AGMB09787]|uniref:ABC transporter substrate-binding protein n=1 Tax=Anaerococcus sp. AGMB09787 TaxID=2922869 RepID=UPI001FAF931E|nr:sugar ABC transporter substrate-binding protein [Anaerococcus sp. AGMB09787]
MKYFKVLLGLALCTMICSCSSNGGQSKQEQNSDEAVRLSMWDTNQEKVMKEIVADFEKENPDIKVQIEMASFKDHFTKLETQYSGSVMPDIFFMNGPNFQKFASNNVLEPLDDLVENKEIDLSNIPDALIDLYTYEGKLYGLPKDWDLTALWYNKEIFDNAGVPYPTNDWTWDDLKNAAEKLNNPDEGIWAIASQAATQEGLYDTIPQNGGYIISEDAKKCGYNSKEAIEATQIWIDLLKDGLSPDIQTQTDTSAVELFKAGKLAMIYSASWNVPEYMNSENIKDKVDLVVMPKLKERAATIHGLSYALSSQSKNKENAKKFLAYLSSKEVNDKWAKSGAVIPANEASLEIWTNAYPDINLKAYIDELEYAKPYPISKNTSKWNYLETMYLNEIFALQKDVDTGLNELAEEINVKLQEEK